MRREEYLHTLTEQIRCKMARGTIEQEINDHIEDQKAEFLGEGMSQAEAEEAAVREMGDPVEVGLEMDRIHRPTMAWGMIALIIGLSLAGYLLRSVMYQTALGIEQSVGETEELFWTGMSSSWHTSLELPALLLGLVLMIGICYMDYTRIAAYAKPILIAYQVLLLVGLQVAGAQVNGSTRYLIMPFGLGLNLIDLLWLTIPLFAAVLYSYRGQGYRAILKTIIWMIIPTYFLIIRSQSLIASMILEVVYCVVLAAAVYKGWFQVCKKAVLTGIGAVVVLIPVLLAGGLWCFGKAYQKERVAAILSIGDRAADFPRVNVIWEMISGSSAFHGNPQFKELLTSVDGSVHLLASVVAAYGILAGIVLVLCLVVLIFRFARISLNQKNQLGMVMGTGCTALFLIQAAVFILENLGGGGNMGIYCPFFGTGRSGMLTSYILLGLLLSICRYQKTAPEPVVQKKDVPGWKKRFFEKERG